jgi:hypothetical protein
MSVKPTLPVAEAVVLKRFFIFDAIQTTIVAFFNR